MARKAVTLLSGGLDSTTTTAIALSQGFDVYAMTFRYGQRHDVEIRRLSHVRSFAFRMNPVRDAG